MTWIHALMLLLVAPLVGWIPALGPLLLGALAGRAHTGWRGAVIVVPGLALQTLLLLGVRWATRSVQQAGIEGGLWTALAWVGGPLSAALGRPLSHLIGDSDVAGFVVLYLLPVVPGLLLGWWSRRSTRRW